MLRELNQNGIYVQQLLTQGVNHSRRVNLKACSLSVCNFASPTVLRAGLRGEPAGQLPGAPTYTGR
jgi:hypothetical protein